MANNSLNIWARLKLHQETSEEVHKQRTWTRIYYVYEFQVYFETKILPPADLSYEYKYFHIQR